MLSSPPGSPSLTTWPGDVHALEEQYHDLANDELCFCTAKLFRRLCPNRVTTRISPKRAHVCFRRVQTRESDPVAAKSGSPSLAHSEWSNFIRKGVVRPLSPKTMDCDHGHCAQA